MVDGGVEFLDNTVLVHDDSGGGIIQHLGW
jgi:hypothetical protein